MHVYRLVTAATVEENILRKADQKRLLGHLAIEGGHFTTSYLRMVRRAFVTIRVSFYKNGNSRKETISPTEDVSGDTRGS